MLSSVSAEASLAESAAEAQRNQSYVMSAPHNIVSQLVSQSSLIAEQSPGVDSGGLVFIDYSPELYELLASQLQSLRDDMYLLLEVEPGIYWIGYEQWDIEPEYPYPAWYRNIVIMPVTTE